jgi:hypothetical protein
MRFLSFLSVALIASVYAVAPIQQLKNKVVAVHAAVDVAEGPRRTDCASAALTSEARGFGQKWDGHHAERSCLKECCGTCFKSEFPPKGMKVQVSCLDAEGVKNALADQAKLEAAALASDKGAIKSQQIDEQEEKLEEQLRVKDAKAEDELKAQDAREEAKLAVEDAADNKKLADEQAAQAKREEQLLATIKAKEQADFAAEKKRLEAEEKKQAVIDAKALADEASKLKQKDAQELAAQNQNKPR